MLKNTSIGQIKDELSEIFANCADFNIRPLIICNSTLYIANLINWHMKPLNSWQHSPSREEKDRTLLGETMYRDIMLLNQADRYAH